MPIKPLDVYSILIEDLDDSWVRKNEGGTVIGGEEIFYLKLMSIN